MSKPICQNFTELAAYLRDIDPAAATSIAKSILERVDIPELREFVAPAKEEWEDVTGEMKVLTNKDYQDGEVSIAHSDGNGLIDLFPNGTWRVWGYAKMKVEGSKIWRRSV